jgi:hypothetical protein
MDFFDLVKLGFNEIILERGYENTLISQGKTMGGDTVEAMFQSQGVTLAGAEEYVTEVKKLDYKGNPDEFVPWFVMKLLTATLMIYFCYQFMKDIPAFAVIIAGNPKFVALFRDAHSSSFGTGVSSPDLAHEGLLGKGQKELGKLFQPDGASSNVASRSGSVSPRAAADIRAKTNESGNISETQ